MCCGLDMAVSQMIKENIIWLWYGTDWHTSSDMAIWMSTDG